MLYNNFIDDVLSGLAVYSIIDLDLKILWGVPLLRHGYLVCSCLLSCFIMQCFP